jgi:hypothetical protein
MFGDRKEPKVMYVNRSYGFTKEGYDTLMSYNPGVRIEVLHELGKEPRREAIDASAVAQAFRKVRNEENTLASMLCRPVIPVASNLEDRVSKLEYELNKLHAARMGEMFRKFMQEPTDKRAYIHRYATFHEGKAYMFQSPPYEKYQVVEYDDEKLLELLTKVPSTFIIYGGAGTHHQGQAEGEEQSKG